MSDINVKRSNPSSSSVAHRTTTSATGKKGNGMENKKMSKIPVPIAKNIRFASTTKQNLATPHYQRPTVSSLRRRVHPKNVLKSKIPILTPKRAYVPILAAEGLGTNIKPDCSRTPLATKQHDNQENLVPIKSTESFLSSEAIKDDWDEEMAECLLLSPKTIQNTGFSDYRDVKRFTLGGPLSPFAKNENATEAEDEDMAQIAVGYTERHTPLLDVSNEVETPLGTLCAKFKKMGVAQTEIKSIPLKSELLPFRKDENLDGETTESSYYATPSGTSESAQGDGNESWYSCTPPTFCSFEDYEEPGTTT